MRLEYLIRFRSIRGLGNQLLMEHSMNIYGFGRRFHDSGGCQGQLYFIGHEKAAKKATGRAGQNSSGHVIRQTLRPTTSRKFGYAPEPSRTFPSKKQLICHRRSAISGRRSPQPLSNHAQNINSIFERAFEVRYRLIQSFLPSAAEESVGQDPCSSDVERMRAHGNWPFRYSEIGTALMNKPLIINFLAHGHSHADPVQRQQLNNTYVHKRHEMRPD
jgi:hypothetical protein